MRRFLFAVLPVSLTFALACSDMPTGVATSDLAADLKPGAQGAAYRGGARIAGAGRGTGSDA